MAFLKKELKQIMLFWGYTNDPAGGEGTETSFFNYDEYSSEEAASYQEF